MATKRYKKNIFGKILVPIVHGCESRSALAAAHNVVGEGQVLLVGFVCVPEGESLSGAAVPAREVRQTLKTAACEYDHMQAAEVVHAAHNPWDELVKVIQNEKPDLLILEWRCHFDIFQITTETLIHPPCDIAVAVGEIPLNPKKVLVSIRGGPYAELALRLSLAINRNKKAKVTSLHLTPVNHLPKQDAPFRSLNNILIQMPEIKRKQISTDDPAGTILKASRQFDLVVMGATARQDKEFGPIGPLAESILQENKSGVIIVKTKRPMPTNFESLMVGHSAISVLVDKWFAENTYHADEFHDLEALLELKRKQRVTISLALPALNEEETIKNVIQTVRAALMESVPLLDEIVLIDSNSSDRTREIAQEMNIPVYIHQDLLERYGARKGKGEALWKSLCVTKGDIVLWIDTDIVNIQPHFVYGLIGPLLLRPEIKLVKGFYQRPLKVDNKLQAGGGGRVTELTARPLLNLFYPELSGLIQPLAGEYGGRREALEKMPFSSGYGVEIGLLIDILDTYGVSKIAQVDLQERIHHNQSLESLSKMSFTIIQTVFHKLERRFGRSFLEEVNRTMKLIRYEPGRFFLEVEEISEQERPPMIEIPEYRERYQI
jgi:glycosyltransferase involved in cell wall biosynthesis/nucleotide-binding universal stress UspA family protein